MCTIISKPYSNFLWYTSWLSCISGLFAVYRGHYYLAPAPFGVWLTSINYWYHPDYSWRRYIDMIYVHIAIIYKTLYAYNVCFINDSRSFHFLLCNKPNIYLYYGLLLIGVLFLSNRCILL